MGSFVEVRQTGIIMGRLAHGGHLAPGTEVFACEFAIHAFDGPQLDRQTDSVTQLSLWQL